MTARHAVTDEQRLAYQAREYELRGRFLKGVVNPDDTLAGIQALSEGRFVSVPAVHVASDDPLSGYRKIKNLIFVGPEQWNKATTSRDRKNRNPLGLIPDWCPRPVLPYTIEQMKELARFCEIEKAWRTRVVFYLALPKVGEVPTSLIGQYKLWGVAHDNLGPGVVRRDVFWSNWFIQPNYDWAGHLPVAQPTWMIGYEHPLWTTEKNWPNQQAAAADRKMTIVAVSQDILMMNLVLAATGKRLRGSTYSRTSTIYDGSPLSVDSRAYGVDVYRYWASEDAYDDLAASVQGVPSELGF